MFSALNALDPLDQQEERGKDDDRQADVDHVGHGALLGQRCYLLLKEEKSRQKPSQTGSMRAPGDP